MRSNLCRVCAHRANVSLERPFGVPLEASFRDKCSKLLKTRIRRVNGEAAAQNSQRLLALTERRMQVGEQQIGFDVFRVVPNGLLKIGDSLAKLSGACQRESAIKISGAKIRLNFGRLQEDFGRFREAILLQDGGAELEI